MSQAIQMPSLTQEPQLLDMTIESLFLQVLKECIELIPGNLSNPQPRHVLTNLMEAITYPLCFEDRHPQEYPVDNISTQCKHNITLTHPSTSEQNWKTTNITVQTKIKKYKNYYPLKDRNFLFSIIQVPHNALFTMNSNSSSSPTNYTGWDTVNISYCSTLLTQLLILGKETAVNVL